LLVLRAPRTRGANSVKDPVSRFEKDGSGATAIEYALIAACIAGAIITVVKSLGTELQTTFGNISSAVDASAETGSADSSSSESSSSDTGGADSSPSESHHRHASDRRWFDHDHDHDRSHR
jgi:pilus assembly protein Flp/PilA